MIYDFFCVEHHVCECDGFGEKIFDFHFDYALVNLCGIGVICFSMGMVTVIETVGVFYGVGYCIVSGIRSGVRSRTLFQSQILFLYIIAA